jgi:hypothetical protein
LYLHPVAPIEDLSDADLIAAVASVVRSPRTEPANSFVLHAPLELAARAALLSRVASGERGVARAQIEAIATTYEAFGPSVPLPRECTFNSLGAAASRLADATTAGDLDEVDAVSAWLGRHARSDQLAPLLANTIVPSLAAAAHGSIFLFHMPRVAPRGELTGELLRPLAREIARNSTWRLRWFEGRDRRGPASPEALFAALQATPRLGIPGSDFIYPLMSQVEGEGIAASLLTEPTSAVDVEAAARVTLRAAALSMLQEPGDHAPYGWSHCLTMPQAVLGIARWCADPSVAIAVAATYVVGFRAALAVAPLEARWVPDDPGVTPAHALDTAPEQAAAAVWYAPAEQMNAIVSLLATRASRHHDAHLVKYTLACLDSAYAQPDDARLYLSAAASLHGWWTAHDLTTTAVASA